jgi:hypothetical protein
VGTLVTVAEAWNGTAWTIQTTPNPVGATLAILDGVSCSSASACTAVGYSIDSSGTYVPLAEGWDGTTWTIHATPNPTGARLSLLNGVSCSSATVCIAVGSYVTSSNTGSTLAEAWDGTSWSIRTTPNPAGATDSRLSGVSCSWAATACTAVGLSSDGSGTHTLAEAWDGTAWTLRTTPNPAGATDSQLSGVSCSSAAACTAVGHYRISSGSQVMLVEAWSGTGWTVQTTPNPAGATGSALDAVSCSSASACTAVGLFSDASGTHTLAEARDGTAWTIQSTPDPPGAVYSVLDGVACNSAAVCTAVGDYYGRKNKALAEAEQG